MKEKKRAGEIIVCLFLIDIGNMKSISALFTKMIFQIYERCQFTKLFFVCIMKAQNMKSISPKHRKTRE